MRKLPIVHLTLPIVTAVLCLFTSPSAQATSLLRIDKTDAANRNQLLEEGVILVAELSHAFFATGDPTATSSRAAAHGLGVEVLAPSVRGWTFALAGFPLGSPPAGLDSCGKLLRTEDDWALLKTEGDFAASCRESTEWFFRLLDLRPLAPTREEPAWLTALADGRERLQANPLVAEMVTGLSDDFVTAHWQAIVGAASTRHSTSQGCLDASGMVYQLFADLGLDPEYQYHTSGHAPNVVGTIVGETHSDEIFVVIGHLDDLPSSGPAPGADDNASGSAMVTALAEVMSCYRFAKTVKLVVVTGEEFGLYGSSYFSQQAVDNGDNIVAVFNADMIGWEGNGQPAVEDLDLNLHSSWPSLGPYFESVAADYATGTVVNAFICDSMVYSDHAPFWDDGFPAVCAITDNEGFCGYSGHYPYYHSSNDTIDNCGAGAPAFIGSTVRTFLAASAHMAQPIARVAPAPQGLVAQPDGDNRIALSWDDLGSGVIYEINRSPDGCALGLPGLKIGETTATSYLDANASGTVPYAYTIQARPASSPCLSEPSSCVEATTTGPCFEAPRFAGLESASNVPGFTCQVALSWQPVEQVFCGSEASYTVYRSMSPGFTPGSETRITSGLSGTGFVDFEGLESGVDFHYIVRAVDASNGVEEANTREQSATPTGPIAIGTWSDDGGDTDAAKMTTEAPWSVLGSGGDLGPAVYATGAYGNYLCSGLVTPLLSLGSGAVLEFSTKYDIEDGWDKGEVQVSTDGGGSWDRIELSYPVYSDRTSDSCDLPTGNYFTETDLSYSTYTAPLYAWAGQEVLIRWALSTDTSANGDGWWVDDISISNVEVPGPCTQGDAGLVFRDGFESGNTAGWAD